MDKILRFFKWTIIILMIMFGIVHYIVIFQTNTVILIKVIMGLCYIGLCIFGYFKLRDMHPFHNYRFKKKK